MSGDEKPGWWLTFGTIIVISFFVAAVVRGAYDGLGKEPPWWLLHMVYAGVGLAILWMRYRYW
jgi:hypothetical protein